MSILLFASNIQYVFLNFILEIIDLSDCTFSVLNQSKLSGALIELFYTFVYVLYKRTSTRQVLSTMKYMCLQVL